VSTGQKLDRNAINPLGKILAVHPNKSWAEHHQPPGKYFVSSSAQMSCNYSYVPALVYLVFTDYKVILVSL